MRVTRLLRRVAVPCIRLCIADLWGDPGRRMYPHHEELINCLAETQPAGSRQKHTLSTRGSPQDVKHVVSF